MQGFVMNKEKPCLGCCCCDPYLVTCTYMRYGGVDEYM